MIFSHGLFKPTYVIPTGLIIPYTDGDGGAPTGWSLFGDVNDYNIIGAGDTYAPGDHHGSGTGDFIATIATIATHMPTSTVSTNCNDQGGKYRNNSASGAHSHTALVPYVPPYQSSYLIKAAANQLEFPTNSVLWTYGEDKSSIGVSNIWTDGEIFKAAADTTGGGSASYNGIITDSQGQHHHGIEDSGDSNGYNVGINAGGHTHTIDITMTNLLRQQALAAWQNGVASISLNKYGSKIIGMYESLTPPAGWHLCNGSNGTPDMRNYFIKNTSQASAGASSGSGSATAATAGTIAHGAHAHKGNNDSGFGAETAYHESFTMVAHAQLNDTHAWIPPYWALAFIMKG